MKILFRLDPVRFDCRRVPGAGRAAAGAQARGPGRELPAWLRHVGKFLRSPRGRAGRDRKAAERILPVGLDGERFLLSAVQVKLKG